METRVTKHILERFTRRNNLDMHFYSDGDGKSYKYVEYIYGDIDPVDKRMHWT